MGEMSMQHAAQARITALLPLMEARYAQVRACLQQAERGEELPDWQLALARKDLESVLTVMSGDEEAGDDE